MPLLAQGTHHLAPTSRLTVRRSWYSLMSIRIGLSSLSTGQKTSPHFWTRPQRLPDWPVRHWDLKSVVWGR
jgi:hypothetical protein